MFNEKTIYKGKFEMKKIITLCLIAISLFCLVGCNKQNAVLDEKKTYEVASEIQALNIQINAADFKIKTADEFSVESNLKYLSVTEQNGILTIVDEAKNNSSYSNATLTVYVPNGKKFDNVSIKTGAANLIADTLIANTLELQVGTGVVTFVSLNVNSSANIEGGAGEITILSGVLNNLDLKMGVGALNLTAIVLGDNNFEFGIGESDIKLIGNKDEYKIDVEKGLGSITIDGESVKNLSSSGNGQNHIKLKGGIGSIWIDFK